MRCPLSNPTGTRAWPLCSISNLQWEGSPAGPAAEEEPNWVTAGAAAEGAGLAATMGAGLAASTSGSGAGAALGTAAGLKGLGATAVAAPAGVAEAVGR